MNYAQTKHYNNTNIPLLKYSDVTHDGYKAAVNPSVIHCNL